MVKFRLYYDKDKEQDWLMEMVNRGWAVKKFFLGFYTFEPCEPGEYIYQIKLYPLSRTFLKLEILIDGHLSFA